MKDSFDMAKGPDPQAEAMQQDFARAAGTDPAPGAGAGSDSPPDRPDHAPEIATGLSREATDSAMSFAHEASPQPEEDALKRDFNLASGDLSRETTEARDRETPGTPALEPEVPPEYRLPPDLQAAQDQLDRKLDFPDEFAVGLKKYQGPSLGF
jgi:hypothetical protein